ncbi:hypothetical protein Hanom_Chr13g01230151 [Helianthus anomalus]
MHLKSAFLVIENKVVTSLPYITQQAKSNTDIELSLMHLSFFFNLFGSLFDVRNH